MPDTLILSISFVFRSLMLACMIDDQPYLQEDRHFGRAGITSWLSQQQDGPDDD
jgi:hypothetical protein